MQNEENKASGEFVLTRAFDAPPELLFEAWTQPERLKEWWGPKGFSFGVRELDLRPGGVFHYFMKTPDGREMWGKWVFREIIALERLVFTNSFSDEEANLVRHPMAPEWPLESLTTVTFAGQEGGTTLTLRSLPINAFASERRFFTAAHDSMRQGWSGSFDQLDQHLITQQEQTTTTP